MPKTYTTIQGDTWDIIALRLYKEERYMHVLLEANSEYNKIIVFPANIVLQVPDIVIQEYRNLPPWKR